MDTRLQEALDFSNYRLTLSTQLDNLKIKLQNDLLVTYQNAVFVASKESILFCNHLTQQDIKQFPFEDINGRPVMIDDVEKFKRLLDTIYRRSMVDYYNEYTAISKARNIKKVVGYND